MGLKEPGLRGSLRNVSVGIDAIPDSAIAHYKLAEEDNGDVTIIDELDNHNGTNQGTTSVESDDYVGGRARNGNGTDEYIELTGWGDFGSTLTGGWAILFTLETEDRDIITRVDNSGNQRWDIGTNDNFGSRAGHLRVAIGDDNNDRAAIDTDIAVDDGMRRRIAINAPGTNPSNWEVWVATNSDPEPSKVGTNVVIDEGISSTVDFDRPVPLFARNNSGSIENHINATLDDVIPSNASISESDIQRDANRQPWL